MPPRNASLAAALVLAAACAQADPGYDVVTACPNEGVAFVDLRYRTTKPRDGAEVVGPEIGFGYGVTRRWTSELFPSAPGPAWWPRRSCR